MYQVAEDPTHHEDLRGVDGTLGAAAACHEEEGMS